MSPIHQAVEDYLAIRRALGFKLYCPGKALESFARFADREGATKITTQLALRWAKLPANVEPATWADRLALVRRFARFLSSSKPETEIPPEGLLPHRRRRKPPFIYKQQDIRRLLQAARQLRSEHGLRPHTYETLFGLIASTGLRISEALALNDSDIDLDHSVLIIRHAKFGKKRYVPVHRTTRLALGRYMRKRDSCVLRTERLPFFVVERGTRLSASGARWIFHKLVQQVGIRVHNKRAPRIHELRHTFAVNTLLRWYRTRVDVEVYLPRLATYLGHAHVNDTYWYISAVPELLQQAVRRMESMERRRL